MQTKLRLVCLYSHYSKVMDYVGKYSSRIFWISLVYLEHLFSIHRITLHRDWTHESLKKRVEKQRTDQAQGQISMFFRYPVFLFYRTPWHSLAIFWRKYISIKVHKPSWGKKKKKKTPERTKDIALSFGVPFLYLPVVTLRHLFSINGNPARN